MPKHDHTAFGAPTGEDGELIDRLMAIVDDSPDVDPQWWRTMSFVVVHSAGGVNRQPVDPENPPKPDSLGAQAAERYGTATRDEYMDLIRARLLQLVRRGLAEEFLVRGLRDELLRWVAHMADTEGVDDRRAKTREMLRRDAEDPAAIERFRQSMAERDPEAAALSDEEVRQRLLDMAARDYLDPLSPERVVNQWAVKDHLEELCEALLSDATIEDWSSRRALGA